MKNDNVSWTSIEFEYFKIECKFSYLISEHESRVQEKEKRRNDKIKKGDFSGKIYRFIVISDNLSNNLSPFIIHYELKLCYFISDIPDGHIWEDFKAFAIDHFESLFRVIRIFLVLFRMIACKSNLIIH